MNELDKSDHLYIAAKLVTYNVIKYVCQGSMDWADGYRYIDRQMSNRVSL